MPPDVAIGLDTFGDVTAAPDGTLNSAAHVLRDVVDEAVLADEVGLEAFGVGEHHRRDFAISAPEVVLAAIASRTSRILLGSAVTVLSTDDPVRVFERFSTLNALSNGRAEVILGRGSFTESYPLFGYDLSRYEELFEDRLRLFAELVKPGPVTWRARHAARDRRRDGVSADRERGAASVGRCRREPGVGRPRRALRVAADARDHRRQSRSASGPFVDLYMQSLEKLGKPLLPIAVHSPGHVGDNRRAGERTSCGRTTR